MDYFQPDFYHFSEDSITLSNFVKNNNSTLIDKNCLDAFAGCGVIGIEISNSLGGNWSFIEKNTEYEEYIKKNISNLSNLDVPKLYLESILTSYSLQEYDLIVANPPYFFKDSSRSKKDKLMDDCFRVSFDELCACFNKLISSLKPQGEFHFIMPRISIERLQDIYRMEVSEIDSNQKLIIGTIFKL